MVLEISRWPQLVPVLQIYTKLFQITWHLSL